MKMTTTPPASWTGNLFRRPPLGVYTVTGTPEDAVARCLDLWGTIGVHEQTHGMPQQFARRGWVGTEITIDASSTEKKTRRLEFDEVMMPFRTVGMGFHFAYQMTVAESLRSVTDTVGEVAGSVGSAAREAAGGVVDTVGGVASFVGSAAREAAGGVVDTVGEVAGEVVDTVVEATGTVGEVVSLVGDEAFQWLERKLTEQNVLLDVPHYVNQKDLPADSALTANCLAVMRQAASTEPLS